MYKTAKYDKDNQKMLFIIELLNRFVQLCCTKHCLPARIPRKDFVNFNFFRFRENVNKSMQCGMKAFCKKLINQARNSNK